MFQKDQVVWVEYNQRGPRGVLHEARVSKVGRKWVYFDMNGRPAHRAAIGHPYLDGGDYSSPGRVWASADECRDAHAREAAWAEFKGVLQRHYHAPRGATPENLLRICGILGISS
jgi:hypothetical protein